MQRRNTYLIARISPEKKQEYERLAKSEGMSVGALIRWLLEAYAAGARLLGKKQP